MLMWPPITNPAVTAGLMWLLEMCANVNIAVNRAKACAMATTRTWQFSPAASVAGAADMPSKVGFEHLNKILIEALANIRLIHYALNQLC